MPRANSIKKTTSRASSDAGQIDNGKLNAASLEIDQEAPSSLSDEDKRLWLQCAHMPEVQFSLEHHKASLDFALRYEDALRMETELEQEIEDSARTDGAADWVGSILKQSIAACPPSQSIDFDRRFPACEEAFEAWDIKSPIEAMLAAQAIAFNSHTLNALRKAGSAREPEHIVQFSNLALKMSTAHLRISEAMHKLKNKGQQKVTVEHVQIQDGATKAEGHRVTVSRTGDNEDDA